MDLMPLIIQVLRLTFLYILNMLKSEGLEFVTCWPQFILELSVWLFIFSGFNIKIIITYKIHDDWRRSTWRQFVD